MSIPLGTKLFTFFQGRFIGQDEFGNRYYEARTARRCAMPYAEKKRWVLYNGIADASKVPAHWHGWLHYTLDTPIPEAAHRYGWMKQHLPNLTGTVHRYLPQGHVLKTGVRAKATADYQAWKPE